MDSAVQILEIFIYFWILQLKCCRKIFEFSDDGIPYLLLLIKMVPGLFSLCSYASLGIYTFLICLLLMCVNLLGWLKYLLRTSVFQVSQFKHILGVKPTPPGELQSIPVKIHSEILKLPSEFDARTAWPKCSTIGNILGQSLAIYLSLLSSVCSSTK